MIHTRLVRTLVALLLGGLAAHVGAAADEEPLEQGTDLDSLLRPDPASAAIQSFFSGERAQSLATLNMLIETDPSHRLARLMRAEILSFQGNHRAALADYSAAIELEPTDLDAINARGSEYFVLGQVDRAVADFDKFVAARPQEAAAQWKRGIALYYAGRYPDGQQQFEQYQTIAQDDVENAVWKFVCEARHAGIEAARRGMLKVSGDTRVPMSEIYELFAGRATPAQVLAAAEHAPRDDQDLNQRLFYAHLYLGLYYEVTGDARQAAQHLVRAARDHKIPHYMWDVARVHARRLLPSKGAGAAPAEPSTPPRATGQSPRGPGPPSATPNPPGSNSPRRNAQKSP